MKGHVCEYTHTYPYIDPEWGMGRDLDDLGCILLFFSDYIDQFLQFAIIDIAKNINSTELKNINSTELKNINSTELKSINSTKLLSKMPRKEPVTIGSQFLLGKRTTSFCDVTRFVL